MTVFSTTSPEDESHCEDDSWNNLARFLRQGVGQEWRAEMEASEFETQQQRLRERSLQTVANTLLHRGDRVTILAGSLQFAGLVAACGEDYFTLDTGQRVIHARLQNIGLVVTKRSSGGGQASGEAPTWRALLSELELSSEPIELYGPALGHPRQGRIKVVSSDHVWLVEPAGVDSYLPLEEIAVIIRRAA
jgi:hypothetical protein